MIRLFEGTSHAQAYALFRPQTPSLVAEKTLDFMKRKSLPTSSGVYDCMIDVGCGSGQSTSVFAPYFKKIIGIDPSKNQIEQAIKNNVHSNITYEVGQAEDLGSYNDVDLITSGQAVHWMDLSKFFQQCNQSLKPEGCLLIHGYDRPKLYPNFDHESNLDSITEKLFAEFYSKCCFHPRRLHIDNRYSEIYELLKSEHKLRDDSVNNSVKCSLSDFVSYLKTWSGYHAYLEKAKSISNDSSHFENDILEQFLVNLKQKWKLVENDIKNVPVKLIFSHFIILSERPLLN